MGAEQLTHNDQRARERSRLAQRRIGGKLLASLRRSQGYSLRLLAGKAEVSLGYVHQLENGVIAQPDTEKLARLANILGADLDLLAGYFGLLAPDLQQWIDQHAHEMASMLREKLDGGGGRGEQSRGA